MNIEITAAAMEDFKYWKSHQPSKAAKIKSMLENILETPFAGIGKPEPQMFDLQGYWSRRIDREHRLVYKVTGDTVIVVACRYHYGK